MVIRGEGEMAAVEGFSRLSEGIFIRALVALKDRASGLSAEPIIRSIERIDSGEIKPLRLNAPLKGVSDFLTLTPEGQTSLVGAVGFSEKAFLIADEVVFADLVRTLAVAHQFPYNGYPRPFREVYEEAYAVQGDYLQDAPEIAKRAFRDVISKSHEELTWQRLGEQALLDPRYEDWEKAIDELIQSGTYRWPGGQAEVALSSLKSVDLFLWARASFIDSLVDVSQANNGLYLGTVPENIRATMAAKSLVKFAMNELAPGQ